MPTETRMTPRKAAGRRAVTNRQEKGRRIPSVGEIVALRTPEAS